ncbi:MAG: uncharacterized protein H6Q74_2485 [Firmicutes bacterium]|nr:uncharacterized protein [Bacillota bacterium]
MRAKALQCVVTFQTTTEAMAFEEAAKENGFSGRIIPLPRAIAAGCGLAWREAPKGRASIEKLLSEHQLGYDRIYELVI